MYTLVFKEERSLALKKYNSILVKLNTAKCTNFALHQNDILYFLHYFTGLENILALIIPGSEPHLKIIP